MKKMSPLPSVKTFHELVYVAGFVYCFAGHSYLGEEDPKCYKYSIAQDTWSAIPDLVLPEHYIRLSNISVKTLSSQSRYILLIRIDYAALFDT